MPSALSMQYQAWFNFMAMMNRPIFGQEKYEFTPIEKMFGWPEEEEEPPEVSPELIEQCKKHGLTPPRS